MELTQVDGIDKGEVVLYALSTCVWCKKTKGLLDELNVKYGYVYVDHLAGDDQKEAMAEVRKWNPPCSFPTLVFNNTSSIVGFKPDQIKAALGL